MHLSHTITVLDRTGLHTGTYVPPPSRQRKVAPRPRFNKADILRKAWADYRAAMARTPAWLRTEEESARRWSYCLAMAWALAKVTVEAAEKKAALAAMPAPSFVLAPVTGRRAEIDRELLALDMIDRQSAADIARIGNLQAERARLSAH